MNTGKFFLGAIFLLVAAYIFFYVPSPAAKIFGGGILAILGLITIIPGLKKKKNKEQSEQKEPEEQKEP